MHRLSFISLFVLLVNIVSAQELRARINVISNRVGSNVDKKTFQTLQTALNNFINNRKWTNDNFSSEEKQRVINVSEKYQLPVYIKFNKEKVWEVLLMDKKKTGDTMNFILLNKIGEGIVKPLPLTKLRDIFNRSL